jgi:toxin ParE1/3/4
MEEQDKIVVISAIFLHDVQEIYNYGLATFGESASDAFMAELLFKVNQLTYTWNVHPENRFLATKKRMYRNLHIASYIVIYRIANNRIEVLRAIHGSRSITYMRRSRRIRPD